MNHLISINGKQVTLTVTMFCIAVFSFSQSSIDKDANSTFHEFVYGLNTHTNDKVNLNWVTTSEYNANYFSVERSVDGVNYDDIAMVFTQEGNSTSLRNYSYPDKINSITSNVIYYRLKMVDMDGTFTYSDVEKVRIEKTENDKMITFPNPSVSEITINIPSSLQSKMVSYTINNMNGGVVKAKTMRGANQTQIANISFVPVGTYVMRTSTADNSSTQKFIKVN